MQIIIIVLFAFLCLNVHAQKCAKYDEAMKNGHAYFEKKNLDKALIEFQAAQIAARECGLSADDPAIELRKVFDGLKSQRDEAVIQKNAALRATQMALQEKKRANLNETRAILAGQQTEAQKEGFRLITVARQKVSENPTVALRIAEEALKKYPDSLIYTEAQQIYSVHSFYKTVITDSWTDFTPFAISPDGTKILIGSNDEARLWSTEGALLKVFKGHTSPLTSLSFSPDNNSILTVSMDSTARLWNVNNTTLKKLIKLRSNIWAGSFSPDSKTFLTGSDDSTVHLWDTSGVLLKELKDLKGRIAFVSFVPGGSQIFGYQSSDTINQSAILWNLDGSFAMGFSQSNIIGAYVGDAIKIIIRNADNTITLWDLVSSGNGRLNVPGGRPISSVNFSPDGNKILIGSMDSTVWLMNVDGTVEKEFKGHLDYVTSVSFTPDGMKIFSGSWDNTIKMWNREGELLRVSKENASGIKSVAASRGGKMIFTTYEDSTATLWTGTGSFLKNYEPFHSVITAAAFLPDGLRIVTGSSDLKLRVLGINGNLITEFNEPAGLVISITCSPDGTQVLTVSADNIVRLWNINGSLVKKYEGYIARDEESYYERKIQSAAFTPGGIKILTSLNDRHRFIHKVKLWSAEGNLLREFKWPRGDFTSLRLSPDGTKIFAAQYDFSFQKYAGILWDTSGIVLKEYRGDTGDFSCAAFSADGSKILSGSEDGHLKIWESMMTLREFLVSSKIDELTPEQKKEFGIQ